jgi:hypothetical protein
MSVLLIQIIYICIYYPTLYVTDDYIYFYFGVCLLYEEEV